MQQDETPNNGKLPQPSPQSLGSEEDLHKEIAALSASIGQRRAEICRLETQLLSVEDFGSTMRRDIEARGLAWLGGRGDMLALSGGDALSLSVEARSSRVAELTALCDDDGRRRQAFSEKLTDLTGAVVINIDLPLAGAWRCGVPQEHVIVSIKWDGCRHE